MLSLLLATLVVAQSPPAEQAIKRAVPFIEKEGAAWITERKCVSCHQVPFMLWSLTAALKHNINVNDTLLTEQRDWSLDFCAKSTSTKSKEKDGGGLDTMGQMLFVFNYAQPTVKQQGDLRDLTNLIIKAQQTDGSWLPGGQLPGQRRPKNETAAVTTGWALLALATQENQSGFDAVRDKALTWFKKVDSSVSNEALVVRLLVARKFADDTSTQAAANALLKTQNADGGWRWIIGDKSDALATGQTLYALSVLGIGGDAVPMVHKYLANSQAEDGSWPVPSTKNGRVAATATYWGTCWAVIGLCETLPSASRASR